MLNALRAWGKRYLPSNSSSSVSVEGARRTAEEAREHRAGKVDQLNADIRRIQHEISDLNDAMKLPENQASTPANESRMAALHQQLAAKQRELGTYQARI